MMVNDTVQWVAGQGVTYPIKKNLMCPDAIVRLFYILRIFSEVF